MEEKIDVLTQDIAKLLNRQNEMIKHFSSLGISMAKVAEGANYAEALAEESKRLRQRDTANLRDFYAKEVLVRWLNTLAAGHVPTADEMRDAATRAYGLADVVMTTRAEFARERIGG